MRAQTFWEFQSVFAWQQTTKADNRVRSYSEVVDGGRSIRQVHFKYILR